MKDGAYTGNIDEYKSTETHLIALYYNGINVMCLDSFGVKYIPKKIEKFIGKKKCHSKYL